MQLGGSRTKTGQPDITFTIDGVEYSSEERRVTAAELLSLARVSPEDHDLARVVGGGVEKRFADHEDIQLTPGAKFVTIFTGPTPVV